MTTFPIKTHKTVIDKWQEQGVEDRRLVVRKITDAISATMDDTRALLMFVYANEGWSYLGYESFEDYLKAEFDTHHSHLRRILNAGLVELSLRLEVGSHPESHMRILSEYLTTQEQRERAYDLVQTLHGKPEAKHYKQACWRVLVEDSGHPRIRQRMLDEEISPEVAHELQVLVEQLADDYKDGDDTTAILSQVIVECSDYMLADMLVDLVTSHHPQAHILVEICKTHYIPSFPDAIHISNATLKTLEDYLVIDSAEARARYVEKNRAHYDALRQLYNSIVPMARDFALAYQDDPKAQEILELIREVDEMMAKKKENLK